MGQQEIRYCSSPDGTRIAYTTYGGGGPALVIFPGWAITFQMELEFEEGVRFYQRLSERRMVVRYDLRGMGASSRKVTDLSIEAHNADAEAVISALGLETYDIFGCAFDSPVALLHAHLHAQAVRRLVLWAPYARGDYSPRDSTKAIIELCKANWPLGARTIADVVGVSDEGDRRKWARMLRDATSPETVAAYFDSRYSMDVSHLVGRIRQPVLALHRRSNQHIPISISRELAAALPNGRFLELPGRTEP